MADIKDVLEKEREWRALWDRMDADRDLYYLTPYVMKDADKRTVPGIISMTLNIPATFAAHVQSSLMSATQQIVVSGKEMDDDAVSAVEQLLEALLLAADARLRLIGEPMLRPFITEQLDVRGRAAARVLLRKEQDGLVADIMPVDTRWLTYEMGPQGLEWAAYRTFRPQSAVKREYPGVNVPFGRPEELVAVTDLWDTAANKVYVGGGAGDGWGWGTGTLAREQANPYGHVPFPIQTVPLGSMLKDKDALAHHGESIFFLFRDLIPEFNRLASIMQTLNLGSVKGPLTWHSPEGVNAVVPAGGDEPGVITPASEAGGFKQVPLGDLKAAGRLMHDMLSRMVQAGSLSMTDFGNLSFPLSAVALVQLGESSGQVFLPRLGATGLLYQQISEMAVSQLLALGMSSVELGRKGHRQSFDVKALKEEYDIEFRYFVKSPTTDVARYSIADVAGTFFDKETVLRDILQVDSPAAAREAKRYDEAEELSPNVKLYRTARALVKRGETVEAGIIADQLGITLEELSSGSFEPARAHTNGKQPARNILPPLLGTRAGSNARASELMGEVAPGQGVE